ncbi:carbon-nitrogen hydrolase family protein [Polyangium aurulentum]|uniref:carbon-nitrogen hydrolase family protein n=1 Tax=Polyangium aurulentum TaxID=2567896 RepID=UPI0010ADAE59|nr:carbon-nitrogen hydrolase family protein [Polyangium aurulentum]UQA57779.1 carbon-nitrogen hydrolase family protein [Polyangium aurulentum]
MKIVVFPEYSIPHDLLERVASQAGELVVVAGTHFVDREAIKSGVYERLGVATRPKLRNAVYPVLREGRVIAMGAKIHPVEEERRLGMDPGQAWNAIDMPGDIESPMGVLVCRDFLQRESESYRTLIAATLARCRFLAVPSLTPAHTLDEFGSDSWKEARRYGRPVLYANHALNGGTSLYVDEGRQWDLRDYPARAGYLEPGEEGMIVADVDLGYDHAGKSTRFEQPLPVVPFAAATFVYRGFEQDYAKWLDGVSERLKANAEDEFEQVEAVASFMKGNEPPLPKGQGTRRRRLEQLLSKADNLAGVEQVERLTREVVLPDGVLPLPVLRAAMARGAAEVIRSWYTEAKADQEIGAFASVEAALLEAADKEMRGVPPASTESQRMISAASEAVRGGPPKPSERALLLTIERYDQALEPRLAAEKAAADALFGEGKYEAARDKYRALADEAEGLGATKLGLATRCRMNVAACSIALGEPEQAREVLPRIDEGLLSSRGRLSLVQVLTALGEREQARALIAKLRGEGVGPAHLVEVEQHLDLDDGKIPETLSPRAQVRVHAAFLLLERNDLGAAAEQGRFALEEAEERNDIAAAHAASILIEALRRTTVEDPPTARFIAVEQRERMVSLIERELPRLLSVELPHKLHKQLRRLARQFAALVWDVDALSSQGEAPSEIVEASANSMLMAYRLADEGKVDEALRALPADDHPWRSAGDRVEILRIGGEIDRALVEALDLSKRFPKRAPIEYEAAWLLAGQGRLSDALAHAEEAFRALPGLGQRCLLAEILLGLGRNKEAWDLLMPIASTDRPRALRLMAVASEVVEPGRTAELWRKYVERRPDDARARVILAKHLQALHRPAEAADVAWKAFEEHGDRLALDALHYCALLQRLPGPPEPRQVERMRAVMRRIRDRFPDDPEAERLRLMIRAAAGIEDPGPEERINFELLERSPYIFRGEGIEQLRDWLQQRHEVAAMVGQLVRTGALPVATACAFNNLPLAQFIRRILRAQREAFAWFCPPIAITDQPPMTSLEGQHLLVSDLELLLLEALGMVELLRRALGETGRLLVFAQVFQRIVQDAERLGQEARPDRLEQQEELLRRVHRFPTLPQEVGEDLDDAGLSRKHSVPLVIHEAPADIARLSPRALVRYLGAHGFIDLETVARIEANLPGEAEPVADLPDPAPPRFLVTAPLLRVLFQEGMAFDAFVEAFCGRIVVAPSVQRFLEHERNNLEEQIEAAKLADKVHRWVGEGINAWIQVLPDRRPTGLPPLRDRDSEAANDLVLAPLEEALAYREVLLEHPSAWRITADFFASSAPGDPGLLREFAWRSVDEYRTFAARVRPAVARHIHLPAVVRLLDQGEKETDERLRLLADLGFPDALGPNEIVRLARRFGGLGKKEPMRLLERQEWIARATGHVAGDFARLRLVQVYGEAIFRAVVGEEDASAPGGIRRPSSLADKDAIARILLERLEEIGRATSTNILDQTLVGLAGRVVDASRLAFRRTEGGYTSADRSPIDDLWEFLASWTGQGGPRRAVYGRAIRSLWCALDGLRREGPDPMHVSVLVRGQQLDPSRRGFFDLTEPATEPLFILSVCWPKISLPRFSLGVKKPSTSEPETLHIGFEDLLDHGARVLEAEGELTGDERALEYGFPVSGQEEQLGVLAPIEALLLRTAPERCKVIAGELMVLQGRHDGVAYRLLRALGKKPTSECVRRAVARHAAGALWRVVRDDPAFLHVWPGARQVSAQGRRPDIDELCAILSEPKGPFPVESTLLDLLQDRFEHGAWSNRTDRGHLLAMASEIPGRLPAATVWLRLENDEEYVANVGNALWLLDHPDETPAARLSFAIFLLRVAATRKPIVALSEGTVDLREILPERLERLLHRVMDSPKPDTLAAHEPALLQVCAAVVQRLAHPAELPLREGLWLAWRLFQWLCLQLQAIDPDARRDGMRRLAAMAPDPLPEPVDRLDPFGFGRDHFDHRLAAVLHALGAMEEIVRVPSDEKTGTARPRSVSSQGIEAKLRSLAERHPEGPALTSVLDWDAPGNVPDLALLALLRLNLGAFGNLSPEARGRWFQALPLEPDEADESAKQLAHAVIGGASAAFTKLGLDERSLLVDRLRAMKDGKLTRFWRWTTFSLLFMLGDDALQPEAQSLAVEYAEHRLFPATVGLLLLGIASRDATRLGAVTDALIAALTARGASPVPVALALGQVCIHAEPPGQDLARDKLAALAKQSPFWDDPRVQELIGFLRLNSGGGDA